jgi:hypothetical protein
MGFDELQNIYRVLGEKDLRIYVDLEDVLGEMEEGEQGQGQPPSLLTRLSDMSTNEDWD